MSAMPSRALSLSLPEARRLAVVSQGFDPRPARPTIDHLRKLSTRVHAFQIDSVNVLARAHYVPAFARLGPYPTDALDVLAYQRRELFEYWGHAACLLPTSHYPLFRYRMDKHAEPTREYMRSPRGAYMANAYGEVAERGPIAASELSDPGRRSGKWWAWGKGKATLEHLYDAGLIAIAGRRRFERLYDVAERVIPPKVLDASAPPREDAMKTLICLAAEACGVGTFVDITAYFNIDGWQDRRPPGPWWARSHSTLGRPKPVAKRLVSELVEEGRLMPARVDGWTDPAYMHPAARIPKRVDARAIVTPFDSLVWERSRIDRLFGMKYSIEMYTPQHKRVYGYYVCPFLLGDTLVARCDLKADRGRNVLIVKSAFLEARQKVRRVASGLAAEVQRLKEWLELDRVEIEDRGDLARSLRRHYS
jgi:uncharacterized protein